MKETRVTLPELALIGGTRAALGAGIGLLLANQLSQEQRRAAGWALIVVGIVSTIPLAFEILDGKRVAAQDEETRPGVRRSREDESFAHEYGCARN